MIRVVALLVGLWLLTCGHKWYLEEGVVRPVSGVDMAARPAGRVAVTGTVLEVKEKDDGSATVRLEAQGQQTSLWLPPGEPLMRPLVYSTVKAEGRAIADGVLAVEAIKTVGKMHVSYAEVVRPEQRWERVSFEVRDSGVWGATPESKSGRPLLWMTLDDGTTLTNIRAPFGWSIAGHGTASGYLGAEDQFFLEDWKGV